METKLLLARLTDASYSTWISLGEHAYGGDLVLETKNTTYRFQDGVCVDVHSKRSGKRDGLRGMRLIGWLAQEGGRISLMADPTPGGAAVLWIEGRRDPAAFIVTSATRIFGETRPRHIARPAATQKPGPLYVVPAPSSAARIHVLPKASGM